MKVELTDAEAAMCLMKMNLKPRDDDRGRPLFDHNAYCEMTEKLELAWQRWYAEKKVRT